MSDPSQLMSAYLDGELDAQGIAELDAWLAADRAHQERFVRLVIDHRALRELLVGERYAAALPDAPNAEARNLRTRQTGRHARGRARHRATAPAIGWMLVAASLMAAVAAAWTWWRPQTSAGPRIATATIETANAAVLIHDGVSAPAAAASPLVDGDHLAASADGGAVVRYADGTLVRLDGGCEAWFGHDAGALRVHLVHGRLSADVAHQPVGHPAVIATPDAEVTVLGTELAVTALGGETLTEVGRGRVSLQRLVDHAQVAIGAGEYALAAPGLTLATRAHGAPLGTTYDVGAGQRFAALADLPELAPGDVVDIHPGTYRGGLLWKRSGTPLRPITIRGVGDAPATIDGDGMTLSGVLPAAQALFQIHGDHYAIERLSFAGAHTGGNASAIHCAGTGHAVIRSCRITHCDVGIDARCDDLLIEDCEIGWCGDPAPNGYSHELHVAGGRAVVRGCDLHDALGGQALKGASRYIELRANRIVAAADGEISFADVVGAGDRDCDIVMVGNLVTSLPSRAGNNQRFIEVGRDAGGLRHGTLSLFNNTFVAGNPRVCFINTSLSAMTVVADSNIFVGSREIARVGAGGIGGRSNWLPQDAQVPPGLRESVTGTDPGFSADARGDYHLRADSPCLGHGAPDSAYRDADGMTRPAGADHEPPSAQGAHASPVDAQRRIGAFTGR